MCVIASSVSFVRLLFYHTTTALCLFCGVCNFVTNLPATEIVRQQNRRSDVNSALTLVYRSTQGVNIEIIKSVCFNLQLFSELGKMVQILQQIWTYRDNYLNRQKCLKASRFCKEVIPQSCKTEMFFFQNSVHATFIRQ